MGRRILSAIGWVAAAVLGLVVVIHVLIVPISPLQETPDRHVDLACWACHFVSESAKIVE